MHQANQSVASAKPVIGSNESVRASWLARMLFVSLACLIAISILSLINLYWLRQAGWWRNHTHVVIEQIGNVETSASVATTWYQAFLVTGNSSGLWRAEKALHTTADQMAHLRLLIEDNPAQAQRAKLFQNMVQTWLREEYPHPDQRRPFPHLMTILNDMRNEEMNLLLVRSVSMETWRSATFYMNCALFGFGIITLAFFWRKWAQEGRWTGELVGRLSEAEARFQAFMDHSPLLAFIKTRESQVIYSNEPWRRLLGTALDPERVEHAKNSALTPILAEDLAGGGISAEDLAERFRRHDDRVFETNEPHQFLEEAISPDGVLHQFLLVMFPFCIGAGSTLLGGLALDVTDTQRTRKALEESEERLRLALQSGALEVWELDLTTGETTLRPGILGMRGDDKVRKLSSQEIQNFVSPEFLPELRARFDETLATGQPLEVTYRTVFGRWISSYGSLQRGYDGKPLRVIGFMHDQTEKIDADRTFSELRRLHDSILRCAQIALISVDKNRVVTSWNPAAERLLGYAAEEVTGQATADLWHSPEDLQERARDLGLRGHLHSDPFLSEALLHGEYTFETIFTRKDGSRLPVRLTITPIFDHSGALMGFLKHATDISELHRATHQVNELSQALQNTVSGWAKLDVQGRFVGLNKAYADTAGYTAPELIGVNWQNTIQFDDLPIAVEAYRRMVEEGKAEAHLRGIRKDGSIFHEQVFMAQARDHLGKLIGSYCFMRDVTARVEAEKRQTASERRYRELFELNPLPCWIYNPQTLRFAAANEAAVRHYGYSQDEFLEMTLHDIFLPEEVDLAERELERFNKSGAWTSGPWHHKLHDGTQIEVELAVRRLAEDTRLVVIRDITQQRQAELIRQSEAKLQEAQAIARLGSWELDARSGAVSWSPETYRIFGLENQRGKFLLDEFLSMVHPADRDQVASAVKDSVREKQRYDLQFRIVRRDGELRYIHGRGQFSNGNRQCLAGTMLDVTEERRAQEALEQSLQQKELLLKEIHHRVKNNLQVISALLNMQAASIEEEAAVNALHESERRVMAMAAIHERLYGHERLDRIEFAEYAETLAHDLLVSYAAEGSMVEGSFNLAPVDLHIEQAVPCGLILNELVTNVLKYAYPGATPGTVFINLERLPKESVRLSVTDRGPGLPAGLDWKKSPSMGASIVRLLTRQLGGTLDVHSSREGTAISVTFERMSF